MVKQGGMVFIVENIQAKSCIYWDYKQQFE